MTFGVCSYSETLNTRYQETAVEDTVGWRRLSMQWLVNYEINEINELYVKVVNKSSYLIHTPSAVTHP
jgi:hypothetical protein